MGKVTKKIQRKSGQKRAPRGTVLDIKGQSKFNKLVRNSEQPVIVDFWAPWCGPCKMQGPVFESASKEFKGRVTFANSITLTPGTVTVDLQGDTIEVHALTEEAAQTLQKGEMDRKVTEMEGFL